MTPPDVLRRVAHALQRRTDPHVTPAMNARLERRWRADRSAWLDRMDAAIDRGAAWFGPQEDLTMSALFVLDQARRRTGDRRLGFVTDRIARYRQAYRDPALRMVLPDYAPADHGHLPDITERRPYQVIELVMIDAVWADQGDPERLLRYLRALVDSGGYGSTHIVVAATLIEQAGATLGGQPAQMAAAMVPSIAAANAVSSYAGDLFAERIFALQLMGRHDLISPAWMMRLLNAQAPDGGWRGRNVPPIGRSNQHTTSLAMAAMSVFVHQERQAPADGLSSAGP